MTGQQVKEILDRTGVMPSKQLGQNFLIDPNMARWIVSQLDLCADDTVVEVGPGTGSLTEHVLDRVKKVILVEFDAKLALALMARFKDREDVEVHHADGAKFDRRRWFKHGPVKFLGNLPYSSGGAIMKNLLSRPHPFTRAVIMLQKEVIERLIAKPGGKEYGVLSLRMQVDWEISSLRVVPPEAFFPRPSIDSAVAVMIPRNGKEQVTFDRKLFDELVRRGFAQRRKQLGKQLPEKPPWAEVAHNLGLSPTIRGEALDLSTWISLTRQYDLHPLRDLPQKGDEVFDVVDENDVPVRTATRAEVHANQWIHRAVHVLVLNRNGDLYLQRRSHLKDSNPNLWDASVSGHLNAGEAYLDAAVRELAEEAGIQEVRADSLTLLCGLKPSAETGWEHIQGFLMQYHGPLCFPSSEIDCLMPFPIDEVKQWISACPQDFSPAFRLLFAASGLSRFHG